MKRLAVIIMCLAALFSMFGGKKDKYILDGPGMENTLGWDSFRISRFGDSMADQNFDITVKYDTTGYVVEGTVLGCLEEEGIVLPKSACRKIDALEPHNLPDVISSTDGTDDLDENLIILDAPTVVIEVEYLNGTLHQKVDRDGFSMKVYEIVSPYFIKKYN